MKKIFVVGLGPGKEEFMTDAARAAIAESDYIIGYSLYVQLIEPLIKDKEQASTPMTKEVDRCQMALDAALAGKTVAMVCSGDAGVYGMAGVMLEVAAEHPEVEIQIVCGVTAACSAAAVLGAPLIHDFAIISLSDLLTPWEKIEKRLALASEADFVICLYNPSSNHRSDYLQKACDVMLRHKSDKTCCGFVRNVGRDGEEKTICTLGALREMQVDMFTTVLIGNSTTREINGRMVTPRGYKSL